MCQNLPAAPSSIFFSRVFSPSSPLAAARPANPCRRLLRSRPSVTDLSARQFGDGAQLTFTMPGKTIHGDRLTEMPAVEILRGALKPDGSPDPKSFHVVETIPGSLANKYLTDDHLQIVDPIPPEETRAHPGAALAYRVRTRVSKKRASPTRM